MRIAALISSLIWNWKNISSYLRGLIMRRIVLTGLSLSILLSGCATEEYVRQQVMPLNDRVGALEQKVSALEAKSGQTADLSPADRQALGDARTMSQKALDEVNRLSADVKRSDAAVSQADAAARRAEEAAGRAEAAAGKAAQVEKKCEKLFQLQQKK